MPMYSTGKKAAPK